MLFAAERWQTYTPPIPSGRIALWLLLAPQRWSQLTKALRRGRYSSSLTAKSRLTFPLSSQAPSGGDADSGGHWCGKRSRAPAVSVLTS
jgi:hypothetical protein